MGCNIPSYKCLYPYGLLSVLILLGISMGLWNEILGPTLPNLSTKLNVSYESMGYVMSFRSVGGIFSLLFAAGVYDSFPFLVHYLMSAECVLAGLATIIIPWSGSYWLVIILFFIQAGCQGAINNGGQLTILNIFKDKAIGKMQLYHLGYGIGGVMSGLISQRFITSNPSSRVKLTKYCIKMGGTRQLLNTSSSANATAQPATIERGFEYIFLISGIFAVCSAIIFLSYKCLRNPDNDTIVIKRKESWLRKVNPKDIANGNACFGSVMTFLLFLYYFVYIFGLQTFMPYIVVYAIDPCKSYSMSQHEATYLHTTINSFFLLGRVLGSLLMDRCPVISLLAINLLNIVFNLILVFFSHRYSLALWIGACGMRFCNSVVYPSGTSFVNRYIVVSSSLISMAFIGTTLGELGGTSFGGYLVDNYPSYYITYSCFTGMLMLLATVVSLVVLGHRNGLRNFSKTPGSSKD